jgi:hypothetical protein
MLQHNITVNGKCSGVHHSDRVPARPAPELAGTFRVGCYASGT